MINYIFNLLINSEEGVNEVPIFVSTISWELKKWYLPGLSTACLWDGSSQSAQVCYLLYIYTCCHKNTLSITTIKNSQKIGWNRPVANKLCFALNIKYSVFHWANMLSYYCTVYYNNNLCFHILQACSFIKKKKL